MFLKVVLHYDSHKNTIHTTWALPKSRSYSIYHISQYIRAVREQMGPVNRANLCLATIRDAKGVIKRMRMSVAQWQGSVVGVYSCFPDAQCVERTLKTRGCAGATMLEVRLNCKSQNGATLLHVRTSKGYA